MSEELEKITKAKLKERLKQLYGSAGVDTSQLQTMINGYVDQGKMDPKTRQASRDRIAADTQDYLSKTRQLLERNATNKEANIQAYQGLLDEAKQAGIMQTEDVLQRMKERTDRLTDHVVDANPKDQLTATVFHVQKLDGEELETHLNKAAFISVEYDNFKNGKSSESVYLIYGMFNPKTFDVTPGTTINNPTAQNIDRNRTARMISFYALKSSVTVEPKPYDLIDVEFPKPYDFSFGIFTGIIKKNGTAPRPPKTPLSAFKGNNRTKLGFPLARP